jgi:hypothetical protein
MVDMVICAIRTPSGSPSRRKIWIDLALLLAIIVLILSDLKDKIILQSKEFYQLGELTIVDR